MLYRHVMNWKDYSTRCTRLGKTDTINDRYNRINRIQWGFNANALKNHFYIDCHCPRPYSSYKKDIDQILKIAIESYKK